MPPRIPLWIDLFPSTDCTEPFCSLRLWQLLHGSSQMTDHVRTYTSMTVCMCTWSVACQYSCHIFHLFYKYYRSSTVIQNFLTSKMHISLGHCTFSDDWTSPLRTVEPVVNNYYYVPYWTALTSMLPRFVRSLVFPVNSDVFFSFPVPFVPSI